MNTKRPYYPFKWQWAEAQAAQVQQQIDDRGAEHIASYERKAIRQKMESLDRLRNERQRFVEMAQRFKQRNV